MNYEILFKEYRLPRTKMPNTMHYKYFSINIDNHNRFSKFTISHLSSSKPAHCVRTRLGSAANPRVNDFREKKMLGRRMPSTSVCYHAEPDLSKCSVVHNPSRTYGDIS